MSTVGGSVTFSEAVSQTSDPVRLWVLWLTLSMAVVPLLLLVFKGSRRDGLILLVANLSVVVAMHALYAQVGFVRLLGLPHIVIWTPLAMFLYLRLRRGDMHRVPRLALSIFAATIVISLVFDYADVVRYLFGDRASMLSG